MKYLMAHFQLETGSTLSLVSLEISGRGQVKAGRYISFFVNDNTDEQFRTGDWS